MINNIHIGKEIRIILDKSGMTYTEFARKIHCERQSLYYLFKSKSIDIDRLVLISKVLNHNFLQLYIPSIETQQKLTKNTIIINIDANNIKNIDEIILQLKHQK